MRLCHSKNQPDADKPTRTEINNSKNKPKMHRKTLKCRQMTYKYVYHSQLSHPFVNQVKSLNPPQGYNTIRIEKKVNQDPQKKHVVNT